MPGISATLRSKHLSDAFLLKRCHEMHVYLHALLMLPALHWCNVDALPRCLVAFLEIRPGRVDPLLAKSNQENRALYEAAVATKRKMEAAFEGAGAARDAAVAKAGRAESEAVSLLSLLSSEEGGSAEEERSAKAKSSTATASAAPKFARDRRRESASLGGVASFGAGIGQTDRAQRIALTISRRIDPLVVADALDPAHSAGLVVIDEQERASKNNTPEIGATAAPGSPPPPLSPALAPAAPPALSPPQSPAMSSALSSASEAASAPPAPPTDSAAGGNEARLSSSLDGASVRGTKQVLVILGGPLTIDGRPGTWLKERLDIGARVFAQWAARGVAERVLIVTGGDCRGIGTAEAEIMKAYLVEMHGVPHRRILTDCQAKDTIQNALLVAPLCVRLGIRAITVITSDFHLPRSKFYFDQIFDAYVLPSLFFSVANEWLRPRSCSCARRRVLTIPPPAPAALGIRCSLVSRSYGGEKHFDITYAGVEDRLGDAERRDRDRKERLLIVRSTPLLRDAVLAIGYRGAAAPGTAGSGSVGMSRTQMRPFGRRNWSMAEDEMSAWTNRCVVAPMPALFASAFLSLSFAHSPSLPLCRASWAYLVGSERRQSSGGVTAGRREREISREY